jgi:hypothetical protein
MKDRYYSEVIIIRCEGVNHFKESVGLVTTFWDIIDNCGESDGRASTVSVGLLARCSIIPMLLYYYITSSGKDWGGEWCGFSKKDLDRCVICKA